MPAGPGTVSGRSPVSRQSFLRALFSTLLPLARRGSSRPVCASVHVAGCLHPHRPSARAWLRKEPQRGRQRGQQRGSEPRYAFRGHACLTSASHGSAGRDFLGSR
ncbi:hypothetical protein NDU88_002672 [Pleurodeles waltl]|uniref:Secreted protein n=1 Tax=Pleurodeles waltl TaxID=8319 RepID=A0AAV7TLB1_PLEWA|nr:hypothetical protein NDU88_002672 [Pleurodeles waltl]